MKCRISFTRNLVAVYNSHAEINCKETPTEDEIKERIFDGVLEFESEDELCDRYTFLDDMEIEPIPNREDKQ